VLEYERIVGKRIALEHARIIAAAVPDEPETVARFATIVVTWRDTPRWNERNVPDLLKHFARHEREIAEPEPARNGHGRPRKAKDVDPAEAFARNLDIARRALGAGPGGVGGPG